MATSAPIKHARRSYGAIALSRSWDEADLARRLCRALEIAKRVLERFAENGYTDLEVPENSFRPEKAVAETAMLLYAARGAVRHRAVLDLTEELKDMLVPHACSEKTLLNMALQPAMALDFAVPYVLLRRMGYRERRFDAMMRLCLDHEAGNGRERPPFGALEQHWIARTWGGATDAVERCWREELRKSVLNRSLDLLNGVREDSYAFTHILMYVGDFGFGRSALPRRRGDIMAQARSLLAKCLDEEDYDLGGELLMAWPLTGASWDTPEAFGFQVLAAVEDQVGVLPAGRTKAERLNSLAGGERELYALATGYHTAYVMGLLAAACLQPGQAPPARLAVKRGNEELLERVKPLLGSGQGHWQRELSRLPSGGQAALAPFLLDLAICQKNRKRDYGAIAELVKLAFGAGVVSPICAQSAQLLERLSSCRQG